MALHKIQHLVDRLVPIQYLALLPPPAAVAALHLHQALLRAAVTAVLAVAALTLLAQPPVVPATVRVLPPRKETTEELGQGGRHLEAQVAVVRAQPAQMVVLQVATAATERCLAFLARPLLTRAVVAAARMIVPLELAATAAVEMVA